MDQELIMQEIEKTELEVKKYIDRAMEKQRIHVKNLYKSMNMRIGNIKRNAIAQPKIEELLEKYATSEINELKNRLDNIKKDMINTARPILVDLNVTKIKEGFCYQTEIRIKDTPLFRKLIESHTGFSVVNITEVFDYDTTFMVILFGEKIE